MVVPDRRAFGDHMTELQQALATESSIEWEGVSYRLGGITLEVMSKWEQWLATDTLERMLQLLGKHRDGEEKAIRAVAKLSASGEFDYFGDASQDRLRTMAGQKKLAYFRVAQHHATVEPRIVAEFVEKAWAGLYRAVLAELIAMEQSLPNAEAPKTTGANPSDSGGEPSSPKSATSSDASQASAASAA
jgi:hypothetical protein